MSHTHPTAGKRSRPHTPESLENPLNLPNSHVASHQWNKDPGATFHPRQRGVVPCPERAPSLSQHPPIWVPSSLPRAQGEPLPGHGEQGDQSQPGAPHAVGPDGEMAPGDPRNGQALPGQPAPPRRVPGDGPRGQAPQGRGLASASEDAREKGSRGWSLSPHRAAGRCWEGTRASAGHRADAQPPRARGWLLPPSPPPPPPARSLALLLCPLLASSPLPRFLKRCSCEQAAPAGAQGGRSSPGSLWPAPSLRSINTNLQSNTGAAVLVMNLPCARRLLTSPLERV